MKFYKQTKNKQLWTCESVSITRSNVTEEEYGHHESHDMNKCSIPYCAGIINKGLPICI